MQVGLSITIDLSCQLHHLTTKLVLPTFKQPNKGTLKVKADAKNSTFFGGGGRRDGEYSGEQGTGKMVVVVGVGGNVSRESERGIKQTIKKKIV
jgi:hypothetical protein